MATIPPVTLNLDDETRALVAIRDKARTKRGWGIDAELLDAIGDLADAALEKCQAANSLAALVQEWRFSQHPQHCPCKLCRRTAAELPDLPYCPSRGLAEPEADAPQVADLPPPPRLP